MAQIDTIADRSSGTAVAGKAYFETSTNKFIVYNGSSWVEFDSDGTGSAPPFENRWAASFDGSNDYLDLGSTNFISRTNPFSVSAWFKLDSWNNSYPGICVLKTGNTAGFVIGLSSGSVYKGVWIGEVPTNVTTGFKGFSTNNATLATTITSGWHHLVLTFDGVDPQASSSTTLYIDGTEYAINYAVGIGANPNVNRVGTTGTYDLNGLIDEFAIFNAELSASDVTAMYSGTAPNGKPTDLTLASSYDTDRTSNLLGYWRMGDHSNDSASANGSITTITDSSGNGNDATQGTASNQPTFQALAQGSISFFPLTQTTDLKLAFSLRKVVSAYSGSAIKVRRSDNSEQDIGFDSNGDLDTSALTTFVGSGDGFVSKWYNQLGSNDASQTIASRQPKIVNSGAVETVGGKPSILFYQNHLSIETLTFVGNDASINLGVDETLFAVASANAHNSSSDRNANIIVGNSSASDNYTTWGDTLGYNMGKTARITANGNQAPRLYLLDEDISLNDVNLLLSFRESNVVSLSTDTGSSVSQTTTSSNIINTSYGNPSIGAGGSHLASDWEGHISEIMQWHTSLSSDADAIKNAVSGYYTL